MIENECYVYGMNTAYEWSMCIRVNMHDGW